MAISPDRMKSIFDHLDQRQRKILINSATQAHIAGDANAIRLAKLLFSKEMVQQEALEYMKGYRQMLIEKGGTMVVNINKETGVPERLFKPWFTDASKEQRETVSDIIRKGIENGKPTGAREFKAGGYPEGSIAKDLQDYFSERKSHAATVARTETARIQSEASLTRYRKAGVKVEYRTARDDRVRPEHRALEGIYDADKVPPIGEPNCRCAHIPVVA
ncbi:TPA_asm: head morphogenesis [Caudoviricetes sp. vir524]|jgi:SPP1 gp7 family putative phage head morphogenesis protein|nr:TPA_asm: head morphogenesis [Caudoviricetes sp. vir524]